MKIFQMSDEIDGIRQVIWMILIHFCRGTRDDGLALNCRLEIEQSICRMNRKERRCVDENRDVSTVGFENRASHKIQDRRCTRGACKLCGSYLFCLLPQVRELVCEHLARLDLRSLLRIPISSRLQRCSHLEPIYTLLVPLHSGL